MSDRYPRTCRNGHVMLGIDDEYRRPDGALVCRGCRRVNTLKSMRRRRATPEGADACRESAQRYANSPKGRARRDRWEASGKATEAAARYRRRQAEARDDALAKALGL